MAVAELKFPEIKNYVGGKFIDSNETKIDVISPLDGSLLSRVPVSGYEALDQAVQSALKAFPTWSATPIKERVQILFNYRKLLQQYREELTELIHLENGKIKSEAAAEIDKAIELTEFAVSLPQLIPGEKGSGL